MDLCTSRSEQYVLKSSQKKLTFTKIPGRGLLPALATFSKYIFILPHFPLAEYPFASYKLKKILAVLCLFFCCFISAEADSVISIGQTLYSSIMLIQAASTTQDMTIFPLFHFIT